MQKQLGSKLSIFSALMLLFSFPSAHGQGALTPDQIAAQAVTNATQAATNAAQAATNASQVATPEDNLSLVVGLGVAWPSSAPDYNLASNVLTSTHEGSATPQYMLGLAYSLGIDYFVHSKYKPNSGQNGAGLPDYPCSSNTNMVRCKPLGVFISAKFSSESSSTVNGVTFGLTHKLTRGGNLSLLLAGSLSPFQQPTPSFVNAAIQVVNTQKAINNPFYAQFDPAAMRSNTRDAFDGFPTVLMTNTGTASAPTYTAGAQIYSGNVLITNYKPGFLIGVALTPNAIKLFTSSK